MRVTASRAEDRPGRVTRMIRPVNPHLEPRVVGTLKDGVLTTVIPRLDEPPKVRTKEKVLSLSTYLQLLAMMARNRVRQQQRQSEEETLYLLVKKMTTQSIPAQTTDTAEPR